MNTHTAIVTYNTLVQRNNVRVMLSRLAVDFANETIDYEKSYAALSRLPVYAWKPELFAIRAALETISYLCDSIEVEWWWNYAHRMEKLVFLSMCLERFNYLSMSNQINPEPLDLPTHVIVITEYLKKLRESGIFEKLRERQLVLFEGNPFYQIYTKGLPTLDEAIVNIKFSDDVDMQH